jgi:predicted Fe-Mo cluster-binding NifX family protein
MSDDFYKANFYCIHDLTNDHSQIVSKNELIEDFGPDFRKSKEETRITAVISPNIRPMAYKILADNAIEVFKAAGKLVSENIERFKKRELNHFPLNEVELSKSCSLSSCSSCSTTTCPTSAQNK